MKFKKYIRQRLIPSILNGSFMNPMIFDIEETSVDGCSTDFRRKSLSILEFLGIQCCQIYNWNFFCCTITRGSGEDIAIDATVGCPKLEFCSRC